MTGRRRPPREPSVPKGFEDVPELSPEEVERRVDVRGGGSPRAPIERPVRRTPPPRRQQRTVARDSLLLIGLVIVGLVAVSFLLPDGPLTGAASTPPGTQLAVASASARPTAAGPTGTPVPVIATLDVTAGPTDIPTAVPPTPTLAPGVTPAPTARPGPTPTLKPGQTPRPTPVVTPGPTTPGTATLIVKMHIVNDSGGNAAASDWTMRITGEVGGGASPNNFPGSESGTTVTIAAGKGYLVTDNLAVAGYGAPSPTSDCHRDPGVGLVAGTTVTCTITRNDVAPKLNVTIAIVGADPPTSPELAVSGANASPSSITAIGTTAVTLDANSSFSVSEVSGPSGYTLDTSGTCSSSGLALATTVSCTYTYTENPPPTIPQLPIAFLPLLLPRRWRPILRR